jgi:hypothetical protein
MPSRTCKCGTQLRFGGFPNPLEWIIMSEEKFDKYPSETKISEILLDSDVFIKCPKCQRVWIYWQGFDNSPTCYIEEHESDAKDEIG